MLLGARSDWCSRHLKIVNRARGTALGLRVAGVMPLSAFWQETFAPPLPPPGQRGAAAFGPHSSAEAVLPFPGTFRGLVSAFH
jgi:hypothetical protein